MRRRPGLAGARRGAARLRAAVVLAAIVGASVSGCSRPLPEAGSPQAALYEARCSGCHSLYQPASLGPAMWKFQMDNMDSKYRSGSARPPTADEKAQILDYLLRNSGGS